MAAIIQTIAVLDKSGKAISTVSHCVIPAVSSNQLINTHRASILSMSSKKLKRPIAKEKLRLPLADITKLKTGKPARAYKQLQSTKIALQQTPENTPNHITAIADHLPATNAMNGSTEASQARYTHHRTTGLRKKFDLHILQLSRDRSSKEDTPARTIPLYHEPRAFHPEP